jgi:hypothetical protein
VGNSAVLAALLLSQPQLRTSAGLLRSATAAGCLAAAAGGSVGAVVVFGAAAATVAAVLGAVVSVVAALTACVQPLTLLLGRAGDLSGISSTRYRLGACANASWVGYGVLRHEPNVFLASGIGLCCALAVCTLLVVRRQSPAVVLPARRVALAAA